MWQLRLDKTAPPGSVNSLSVHWMGSADYKLNSQISCLCTKKNKKKKESKRKYMSLFHAIFA